jgi:branched-chain amino acid aminotransferase
MEAEANGYQEGIGLDVNGLVSEGSGENIFIVRNGVLYTPPLANSALSGITRDSVLTLARHLGLTVVEQPLPREILYIADEVFFTGTAAEVSPIRSIDRIVIADGKPGEITQKIADEFLAIANGLKPDRFGWLTPVNVTASEPVTA